MISQVTATRLQQQMFTMKVVIILLFVVSSYASPTRSKRQSTAPVQGNCPRGSTCVPYWQCDGDGNIVTDGTGIIDIRFGPDNTTELVGGSCPNILDVCCREHTPHVTPTPPPPYVPKCGSSLGKQNGFNEDLNIRIHLDNSIHDFDNVAQFGAYPWMAAILLYEEQQDGEHQNVYQCGGSLIHPQVVLTAAHCIDKVPVGTIKVRLGEWDTQKLDDHPHLKHQDRYASKVTIHERYSGGNLFNDVALIFLSEPAELNYHIDTICMPDPHYSYDGSICYATGWGKDNYGTGNWQAILKEIDLPTVDRNSCQNSLKTTRLGCRYCLHDTFMCAGGVVGKDTCEGDGGSPLVCFDPKQNAYVQAGIVAWGIGCGTEIPAAYVDVHRYLRWIQENVNNYFIADAPYFNYDFGPSPYQYEGDTEFLQCVRAGLSQTYNQFLPNNKCYGKRK